MNEAITAYLNTPIPRKVALAVTIGQGLGCTYASYRALKKQANVANAIIADQVERLHIYNEAMEILLEKADPLTLAELNEKLGFWAIIRGHSAQEHKPDED